MFSPAGIKANGINIVIVAGVLIVVASILTILRLYTRAIRYRTFGIEEFFICVTWPLTVVETALIIVLVFRFDRVTSPPPAEYIFQETTLKMAWAGEVIFHTAMSAVKLSFLFFYRRLFEHLRLKYLIDAAITYTALFHAALIILLFLSCRPFAYHWTQVWPGAVGTCLDMYRISVVVGCINISTDLIILLLPVRIFYALQAKTWTKIALVLLFGAGGFITVCNVMRIYYAATVNKHPGFTFRIEHKFSFYLWTALELQIALITVNLPALRMLFTDCQNPRSRRSTAYSHHMSVSHVKTINSTVKPSGEPRLSQDASEEETAWDDSHAGTMLEFLAQDRSRSCPDPQGRDDVPDLELYRGSV